LKPNLRPCFGLAAALVVSGITVADAAESDPIRTAGEFLRIALPLAAGGISLGKHDQHGIVQLGGSEILAEGSSLLLEELIEEERPDKSDRYSFPSDSAAVTFSAASFLQIRYGWRYGLPAYAVAGFVGWSRVKSQRHYWHDVLAGAALGWVASEITASRYHNVPGSNGASAPLPAAFAHGPLGFSFAAHW